ncbi:unnamed protein product [Dovyalis caffra]|uniref:Uncharacterized protein n=1 Tax=Dovyalis caffra TaxID=77055 RepID=A0AAV1SWA4_9ROSI|nr:unnamed protein product [Dovyalis caffra]
MLAGDFNAILSLDEKSEGQGFNYYNSLHFHNCVTDLLPYGLGIPGSKIPLEKGFGLGKSQALSVLLLKVEALESARQFRPTGYGNLTSLKPKTTKVKKERKEKGKRYLNGIRKQLWIRYERLEVSIWSYV